MPGVRTGTPGTTTATGAGRVNAIQPAGTWVYVGGNFNLVEDAADVTVTEVHREHLFRYNPTTGVLDETWNLAPNGIVHDMALSKDSTLLFVVGEFTNIGGLSRSKIAAIRLSDGVVHPTYFDQVGTDDGGTSTETDVYVAMLGDFNSGTGPQKTTGPGARAVRAFLASAPAGTETAILALGDLTGAGEDSATVERMAGVWDTYYTAEDRKRTLPIPGNHEKSTVSPAPYDGYWNYWTNRNVSGQLRPTDLGLIGGDYTSGRYIYGVDLYAPDGNTYWKAILLNDQEVGNVTKRDEIVTQLGLLIDDAEAHTPPQGVIVGWHEPLFQLAGSSYGGIGSKWWWNVVQAYTAGPKIIGSGHIHIYNRYKPIQYNGAANLTTDPTHGITVKTPQQFAAGDAILYVVSGIGGQNPANVVESFDNYWTPIADSAIARPTATQGMGKAVVNGPVGSVGTAADNVTDSNGQKGHPYGTTGFILGRDSIITSFWGDCAIYTETEIIKVFDGPARLDWGATASLEGIGDRVFLPADKSRRPRSGAKRGGLPRTVAWSTGGTVRTCVIDSDGQLYVGGDFTTIAGVARKYLAKLDVSTSSVTVDGVFKPIVDTPVYGLGFDSANTRIIAQTRDGAFWNGSSSKAKVVSLNRTSGVTVWQANPSPGVKLNTLALGTGQAYAGADAPLGTSTSPTGFVMNYEKQGGTAIAVWSGDNPWGLPATVGDYQGILDFYRTKLGPIGGWRVRGVGQLDYDLVGGIRRAKYLSISDLTAAVAAAGRGEIALTSIMPRLRDTSTAVAYQDVLDGLYNTVLDDHIDSMMAVPGLVICELHPSANLIANVVPDSPVAADTPTNRQRFADWFNYIKTRAINRGARNILWALSLSGGNMYTGTAMEPWFEFTMPYVDIIGHVTYSQAAATTPAPRDVSTMFENSYNYAKNNSKRFAVFETGVQPGAGNGTTVDGVAYTATNTAGKPSWYDQLRAWVKARQATIDYIVLDVSGSYAFEDWKTPVGKNASPDPETSDAYGTANLSFTAAKAVYSDAVLQGRSTATTTSGSGAGKITALNLADGTEAWTYETEGAVHALGVYESYVIASFNGLKVAAAKNTASLTVDRTRLFALDSGGILQTDWTPGLEATP